MVVNNPAIEFLEQFQCRDELSEKSVIDAYTRYLLIQASACSFPVNLHKVFSFFRISVNPVNLDKQHRGLITPDLQVFYNALDKQQVQLFSQAHELIEALFIALQECDLPCISDEKIQELFDNKERYCEYGAAQLLMPMDFFLPYIKKVGFSLQSGRNITKVSGLSLTTTLRQMIDTNLREAALIIWKFSHKPNEFVPSEVGQMSFWDMDPPKKPRVNYAYPSPGLNQFIRSEKSVGGDTAIAQAFNTHPGIIRRGYDYLEITNNTGCYLTESISVSFDNQIQVISLVYFDDKVAKPSLLE